MANTLKFGNGLWATKEGSTLAYNDENDNYKPLPFDFTRASSATVVNKAGLIETVQSGIPRVDFQGNTNGALLLEPQRTNLVTYSEDFSNAYWIKSNTSLTSNSVISPDGSLNASLLKGDGVGFFPRIQSTVSGSGQISFSAFVKKELSDVVTLWVNGTGIGGGAETSSAYTYTFSTDSFLITSGGAVDSSESTSFGNGWVRLTLTYTTTTITGLRIYPKYNSTNTEGVYIYGAQLEQGSYATSYIPTSGSSVTRVADSCSNGGNEQVINSTEGVLYFNAMTKDSASTSKAISISNGSNTILSSYFYGASINVVFNINGVNQFYANFSITIGQEYKIAILYQENNFALYVDGVKRAEETNGSVPSINTFNTLNFAQESSSNFYGNVKDVRVYNTALTDEELQALTTI